MLAGSLIRQCGAKFWPGKTRHFLSFKIIDCEAIDLRVKLEFAFLPVAINWLSVEIKAKWGTHSTRIDCKGIDSAQNPYGGKLEESRFSYIGSQASLSCLPRKAPKSCLSATARREDQKNPTTSVAPLRRARTWYDVYGAFPDNVWVKIFEIFEKIISDGTWCSWLVASAWKIAWAEKKSAIAASNSRISCEAPWHVTLTGVFIDCQKEKISVSSKKSSFF